MEEVKTHVEHFVQKCIISAAICLIKCKPKHVTAKDFCKSIQLKLEQESKSKESKEDEGVFDEESPVDIELLNVCNEINATAEEQSEPNTTKAKKSTESNFKILIAIKEVKSGICGFKGLQTSQSQDCPFDNTQDSAYQSGRQTSQRFTNEGYVVERKINKIEESLDILVDFLNEMSDDGSQDHLFKCISDITGEMFDLLYERNIHVQSFSKISDIIELKIDDIINSSDNYTGDVWKLKLKSLYALNKSSVFIEYSLTKLIKSLDSLLHALKISDEVILECDNPDLVDRAYFVFYLIEDLLGAYCSLQSKHAKRVEGEEKSNESELENGTAKSTFVLSQNWNQTNENKCNTADFESRITNVLNEIALECIESYPLVSFWALECIKIKSVTQ